MLLLRVSYKVRVHCIPVFERLFEEEVRPLIPRHGLQFLGVWRTTVGDVGEYMELWQFDSMADFGERWKALMADPALLRVFERTGPMVEDERFTLLEPVQSAGTRNPFVQERYKA